MERNKKFHFWALALAVLIQACAAEEDGLYGYSLTGNPEKTEKGWRVGLSRSGVASLYGNDIPQLAMDVEFQTEDRVRFKIYDPNNQRFEVPLRIDSPPLAAADTSYDIDFVNDLSLRFKIVRKATGTVLWDTSLSDLVFSQQYLRISTNVPSSSVYGFGEHQHPSFKHNMNHITYGMYSRDQSPKMNANLYGVHPFYMCIENDANAHGVLFLNANAQDVTLHPEPSLTFRTIGGVLDFYVFLGPTPENVIQQYTEVKGIFIWTTAYTKEVYPFSKHDWDKSHTHFLYSWDAYKNKFQEVNPFLSSSFPAFPAIGRPHLPPYWSLGYQLSRWGYPDIGAVQQVVKRMTQYGIPYDVQYGDIDYMDRKLDFTYDKEKYAGLPEFMQELKKDGLHYVIILDPFLSKDQAKGAYQPYELGEQLGIWVKNSDGVTPAVGQALAPGNSVYPDYFNPKTASWWTQMCVQFHNVLPYDGIWLDMNEPSNFLNGQIPGCAHNNLNNPPYIPRISDSSLFQNTLCPDSKTFLGDLYDTHSLFGWSEAPPTFHEDKPRKIKSVIASPICQEVMEDSTIVIANKLPTNCPTCFQSKVGADICGFYYDTTFELCLRWTQLGAFYPLSRNHNAIGQKEQDPGVFGLEFATIARSTLQIRYSLLPYLYTLFFEAHAFGNTVARGLMHEFPADPQTHEIDTAFLWGSALMIAPVLQEGARSVDVYFPEASWFDYYTGDKVPDSAHRQRVNINAPLEKIPLFIRGGYILPTQAPAIRTAKSRLNPFGLIVALDVEGQATGSLFWDDGDSADTVENGNYFYARYTYREGHLKTSIVNNNYRGVDSLIYDTVQILGVASRPNAVVMNGKGIRRSDIHYQENGKLVIHLSVPLGEELDLILQ